MKIISFSWTTAALLSGRKTVTRREWKDSYARSFHAGELVAAYNKSPRVSGDSKGKQVATIRLTAAPYQEQLIDSPLSDYEAEGLAWMEEQGQRVEGLAPYHFWRGWRSENPLLWVVRFELVHDRGQE